MGTSENLTAALAVTAEQLTGMTPPQIDALNGAISDRTYDLYAQLGRQTDHMHRELGERKTGPRRAQYWPTSDDEAEERLRKHLDDGKISPWDVSNVENTLQRLGEIREEMTRLNAQGKILHAEFTRRGGWSRFYLVQDGHIHSSTHCHTLRVTTRIGWLPDLSGLTEKDAVDAHGPLLCTVCFPSAPVEWTIGETKPKSDRCTGSGKFPAKDNSRRHYAPCPDCGKKDVYITPSSGKLRAHKPAKTAQAAEEAPAKPEPVAEPAEAPSAPQEPAPAVEEAPKTPVSEPGPAPTDMHVSKHLAAAGHKRHIQDARRYTGGFKVRQTNLRGMAETVTITWVESIDETSRRMTELGVEDVATLGDNPLQHEYLAAYADTLRPRYSVRVTDHAVYVTALPVKRTPAQGAPTAKAVTGVLKGGGLPVSTGGASPLHGCAVVQESDHVRVLVRPWHATGDFTPQDLEVAVIEAERILGEQGLAWLRQDDITGAVLKITGKR